jgi:beta-lactam-binding protein with PASTA domain
MGFFYFLKKGRFYKHLLIAVVLTIVLLWLSFTVLDFYTRHGDIYIVPDFQGKTMEQISGEGYGDYFVFQVIDSVYDDSKARGAVFMQNPAAGSKVKQGRRMYFTIVASMPEMVTMPNLKNLSLRQALVTLDLNGLQTGKLDYVDYFARNAVIDQMINEEPVEPGTSLRRGTPVDLVVGKGDMKVYVSVPFIIGKTHKEALHDLHYASLNLGDEIYLDDDKEDARVYRTEPPYLSDDKIDLGTSVKVWYRSPGSFDFESYIKEILSDTVTADTISQGINNF